MVALLAVGCDESLTSGFDDTTTSTDEGVVAGDGWGAATAGAGAPALQVLDTLKVQDHYTRKDYERDEFGSSWKDVDHNGCDTRNDILHRDLHSITVRKSDTCIVLTGELSDPYTNRIVRFDRGRNASGVQIDHVIPLADAWRTGAYAWTDEQREAFANDPENLLAVDGPTNTSKSDQNASEWLPPAAGYQCPYIARQVGLKSRYQLWVTQAEADAMRAVLNNCPSQSTLGG
ncbi:HNH endonuclease family protein [Frankia nepalensis]